MASSPRRAATLDGQYQPVLHPRSEVTSSGKPMKFLAVLVFLFLTIPGSGHLAWDGLPMNTRLEFLSLIIFALVLFSRSLRQHTHKWLTTLRWHGVLRPAIAVLCLLKLLSFAWVPLGAGFGACYRSIYLPLDDPAACEKSFSAPFIQGHGLPETNISRIESTVDHGHHQFDWSLPFMNEWPRLGYLWLSRLPFSAEYRAAIKNETDEILYLPVLAIGEVQVTVGRDEVTTLTSYDRHFLTAVPIPVGDSQVEIYFRYSDDDRSELPDDPPTPRGPYAELKIGELVSSEQLTNSARIFIVGNYSSRTVSGSDSRVEVLDRGGMVVPQLQAKSIMSVPENPELFREFDLEVEVPAAYLDRGPLSITELRGTSREVLGTIDRSPTDQFGLILEKYEPDEVDLSAILTIDRDSLGVLRPESLTEPDLFARLVLTVLDVMTAVVMGVMLLMMFRAFRFKLMIAAGLGGISWLAVEPMYRVLPGFVGGGRELVIPYALISLIIVMLRKRIASAPLLYALPIASVLGVQKILDHVRFNHSGESADWWGKLVFMWRDSDWFTNHGLARSVFTDSFLRGGEDVFWARAAPRYVLFGAQMLLGENDVLIGMISLTTGFLVFICLIVVFANRAVDRIGQTVAFLAAFAALILIGDQIITAFGFFVTSEYSSWLGLAVIMLFALGSRAESRVWMTAVLAALTATTVHFRPNLVFVCVALLPLVLLNTDRRSTSRLIRQVGTGIASFAMVLPLSLLHNLYFGGRFVPFTDNSPEVIRDHKLFYWGDVWGNLGYSEVVGLIWGQLRTLMFWGLGGDPNLAIALWGFQLIFVLAIVQLIRKSQLFRMHSLALLLPLTYVIPMLSYSLTSYYPRHIVAANLLCLLSALYVWPTPPRVSTVEERDDSVINPRMPL